VPKARAGLAALFGTRVNLLGTQQATTIIELECMQQKGTLGRQQHERLARLRIVQHFLNEYDRIGPPTHKRSPLKRHRHELGSSLRKTSDNGGVTFRARRLRPSRVAIRTVVEASVQTDIDLLAVYHARHEAKPIDLLAVYHARHEAKPKVTFSSPSDGASVMPGASGTAAGRWPTTAGCSDACQQAKMRVTRRNPTVPGGFV
jgi:hypothetical protein